MEDTECHKFTTYSRLSRQEVRHARGSNLRKLEKDDDKPPVDGSGRLSAYHHSRRTGMGIPLQESGVTRWLTPGGTSARAWMVGEGGKVMSETPRKISATSNAAVTCTRRNGCSLPTHPEQ